MDSTPRTLVKAILWQVMGLAVMLAVGAIVTGSVRLGGTLAGLNMAIGLVSYVIYERAWNRIRWGRREGAGMPRNPPDRSFFHDS